MSTTIPVHPEHSRRGPPARPERSRREPSARPEPVEGRSLYQHLPLIAAAPGGIKKLRELILELAVRGKLVPQDPNDEPASELLEHTAAEKAQLVASGRIRNGRPLPPICDSERAYGLPRGWMWARFGDIAINRDGERVPISSEERKRRHGSYDYYGASGVIDKIDGYLFDKPLLLIGEDGANLRNRSTPIAFIASGKYWVNNHAHVIDAVNFDLLRYLELHINAISLEPYLTGTAQPKMNQAKMNLIGIALPPQQEQARIIAKFDELMALCDRLEAQQTNAEAAHATLVKILLDTLTRSQSAADFTASWQRLSAHFDTLFTTESSIDALKQTLLQLAVMGKLVPQDPRDEPVSELLKRIQAEKDKLIEEGKIRREKPRKGISDDQMPFDLPQGWRWVRLGSVLRKLTDGTHRSPPNGPTGDYLYISAKNIKWQGIDRSDISYVTKEAHNEIFSRCDPEQGDVLYIKDGATTGVVCINTLHEPFSMLSSVALLKPSVGTFNSYLLQVLSSPFFYAGMRADMAGVAITRVTLTKLTAAPIPLPPLAEQHRIVAKIDELTALCDRLKTQLAASRAVHERLAALAEQAVTA